MPSSVIGLSDGISILKKESGIFAVKAVGWKGMVLKSLLDVESGNPQVFNSNNKRKKHILTWSVLKTGDFGGQWKKECLF